MVLERAGEQGCENLCDNARFSGHDLDGC